MGKFSGKIGFVKTYEDPEDPGVYLTETTERLYYGDITRNSRRWSEGNDKVNSDLSISNTFSIIADSYMRENFSYMRYIIYGGAKWSISSLDLERPRINITIGGLYNG